MKIPVTPLFATLLCLTTMVIAADDDTKFIPRNYSGKSYQDNNYRAKSYTSRKTGHDDKYRESPKKRSFWNIFKQKEIAEPKVLHETKANQDKLFAAPERDPQPAKQLAEKPATDRAFESHAENPADKDFVPDNRPRPRDPLLAPRQGIKAPVQ